MKSSLLKGWEMLDMILMMVLVGVVAYLFFWRNYYVLSNGDNVSVVSWLWHAWRTDPDSEHGMLVPLISAGLLWWRREEILRCSRQKNAYFAGFIILGSFIYILGAGGGVSSLGPMALILWFLGVIGFIGGAALFKQTLFPIGFLAFMIPWSLIGGDTITVPLRHLMVNIVVPLLNLIGVDVVKVGTAILSAPRPDMGIPAGQLFGLDVDNPCSGIRSLFAITMISALFANLTQPTQLKKWILFFCAFPLAVIGNIFRILMLTIGSYFFGTEFAVGVGDDISFFHMFAGYMVFIIALGFLFFISWLMNLTPEKMRAYRDKFFPKKLSASHPGNSV
ncbi:exosortase/archaeosortase family protein [Oscillatoria laete-virens NRMC-F 0139]|nr:exosortase/archaeosortase family protein [Oscillatoria laete-virens]MDL5053870.1 exosortase/archaeosortase family protein [Oscillatoria laete-virens NRMC-F 0139]